jgi:hypothetical protein
LKLANSFAIEARPDGDRAVVIDANLASDARLAAMSGRQYGLPDQLRRQLNHAARIRVNDLAKAPGSDRSIGREEVLFVEQIEEFSANLRP